MTWIILKLEKYSGRTFKSGIQLDWKRHEKVYRTNCESFTDKKGARGGTESSGTEKTKEEKLKRSGREITPRAEREKLQRTGRARTQRAGRERKRSA